MSDEKPKSLNLPHLFRALNQDEALQRQAVESQGLGPQQAVLRNWQARRLAASYADFLENPRYRQACQFFLMDIYGPKDFTQRDHDLERFHDLIQRFIPAPMLVLLNQVVHLNRLTSQLDQFLLETLIEKLGMEATLTAELYSQAYRLCNNYAERVEQIDVLVEVIQRVAAGARHPLVRPTLIAARLPAQKAGWGELWDFLSRATQAFKPMGSGDEFAEAVQKRELQILDDIYAGRTLPFSSE